MYIIYRETDEPGTTYAVIRYTTGPGRPGESEVICTGKATVKDARRTIPQNEVSVIRRPAQSFPIVETWI